MRKIFLLLSIAFLLIISIVNRVEATTVPTLNYLGSLPGIEGARDVRVNGNYAYVSDDDYGLTVVDISNPDDIRMVGSTAINFSGGEMVLSEGGDFVYVVGYSQSHFANNQQLPLTKSGVFIVDVSDPTNPHVVGSFLEPDSVTNALAHWNGYLYLSSGFAGVKIIDIRDNRNPVKVGTISAEDNVVDIKSQGNYLYIADFDAGMHKYEINNPVAPVKRDSYTGIKARSLLINDNQAYVSDVRLLHVVDISGSSLSGNYILEGHFGDMERYGDLMFTASAGSGTRIFDISNFNNPVFLSEEDTPQYLAANNATALNVFPNGNYVYTVLGGGGLQVIDISDPSNPVTRDQISGHYNLVNIEKISDNYIAVGGTYIDGWQREDILGVFVVDISNKDLPRVVGSVSDSELNPYNMVYRNGILYASSFGGELKTIDVSNPRNPTIVGGSSIDGGVLFEIDDYLYSISNTTLRVLDTSTPLNPSVVNVVDLGFRAFSAATEGNTLVLNSSQEGIRVYDISNTLIPVLQGSVVNSGQNILLRDNILYVLRSGNLSVFDISDRSNLSLISEYNINHLSGTLGHNGIFIGDYIVTSSGNTIDISDPRNPFWVAFSENLNGRGLEKVGQYYYLTSIDFGVVSTIINYVNSGQLSPPPPPPPVQPPPVVISPSPPPVVPPPPPPPVPPSVVPPVIPPVNPPLSVQPPPAVAPITPPISPPVTPLPPVVAPPVIPPVQPSPPAVLPITPPIQPPPIVPPTITPPPPVVAPPIQPPVIPPSSSFLFSRSLKVGDRGEDVKQLQIILNRLGFSVSESGTGSPGQESSYFGNKTKEALIRFQNANSSVILEPVGLNRGTGYFGPSTISFINGETAVSPPVAPPITPPSQNYTFAQNLTMGSRGEDVRQLQILLNSQGFIVSSAGGGSPGNETTYFGNKTKQALIQFQNAYKAEILTPVGLTSGTGFFGKSTQLFINSRL